MKCAVPTCKRESRGYFMGFPGKGGEYRLGYVCGTHDKLFGRQNLKAAGLTLGEAIEFEREIKTDSQWAKNRRKIK